MASWSKAELRDNVLEHMGIKAATQTATAEDAETVEAALDSAFDQLRPFGLVPYSIEAVPEWAQPLLRDYVEPDLWPSYGRPVAPRAKEDAQYVARARMVEQLSMDNPNLPTAPEYY